MSTDAKKVSAAKPMIGGSVYWAPAGTTLPTNATAKLDDAFVGMGYISEDGITNNNERTSEDIKAWGGDTVLSVQNGKTDSFGMTFLESLSVEVQKRIYGESNVSGTLDTGLTIRANATELEAGSWVINMALNDNCVKRIVIPNGKITEIGEVTYKDDVAIAYDCTIKAFPGDDGDTHKEYIVKSSKA